MSFISIQNVIAYLLTDGGVSADKRIYLSNTSGALLRDFKKQAEKAFGKQRFSLKKDERADVVRFSNKEALRTLLKHSPSYRTKACANFPACPIITQLNPKRIPCLKCAPKNGYPPVRVPDIVMSASKKIKRDFLARVFSSDGGPVLTARNRRGYVEIRRMIVLSCTHPVIRAQYSKLLSDFGIAHRINGIQIQIERKEDIDKFRKEINFLPKVSCTQGRWKNVEKRKILELMLKAPRALSTLMIWYHESPKFCSSWSEIRSRVQWQKQD